MAQFALPIAMTAMVLGTAVKGYGQVSAGHAESRAATFEANQMQEQALEERGAAQRDSIEQKRQAKLVESRALAISAAGGSAGGVTDINIAGDIKAEGKYRSMSALFEGEERARGLETGAAVRRYEGREARRAGNIAAIGSVLDAGGSLFSKYGGSFK